MLCSLCLKKKNSCASPEKACVEAGRQERLICHMGQGHEAVVGHHSVAWREEKEDSCIYEKENHVYVSPIKPSLSPPPLPISLRDRTYVYVITSEKRGMGVTGQAGMRALEKQTNGNVVDGKI